jgi:hypothetical protein
MKITVPELVELLDFINAVEGRAFDAGWDMGKKSVKTGGDKNPALNPIVYERLGLPLEDDEYDEVSESVRIIDKRRGSILWMKDCKLHRAPEIGPAFEGPTGHKEFVWNGEHHNPLGPAIITTWGEEQYWLFGKKYETQWAWLDAVAEIRQQGVKNV